MCKHAYAVLDVVEACGRRLVKLKNPWSHVRWKGDFSPGDERNWTPELKVLPGALRVSKPRRVRLVRGEGRGVST